MDSGPQDTNPWRLKEFSDAHGDRSGQKEKAENYVSVKGNAGGNRKRPTGKVLGHQLSKRAASAANAPGSLRRAFEESRAEPAEGTPRVEGEHSRRERRSHPFLPRAPEGPLFQ